MDVETITAWKAAVVAVIAALTTLWGWFGWLVLAWVACMVIDYATGSAAALKGGTWSSKAAREGIWHKVGSVVAVIAAGILDLVIGHLLANVPGVALPFDYAVLLCPLVVVWYILTEIGSIIENAGALGAPIPSWLSRAVEALEGKVDQAGEDAAGDEGKK